MKAPPAPRRRACRGQRQVVGGQGGRVAGDVGQVAAQLPDQLRAPAGQVGQRQPVARVHAAARQREGPGVADAGAAGAAPVEVQLVAAALRGAVAAQGDGGVRGGRCGDPRQPPHRGVRAVGADEHRRRQHRAARLRAHLPPVLGEPRQPRPPQLGPAGHGDLDQAGVQDRPRHDVPLGRRRAAHLAAPRGADPHRADGRVARQHAPGPEPVQLRHPLGADGVPADLVARERGAVDQDDPRRGTHLQEPQRRRRPGRPGPDDQEVDPLHRHEAMLTRRPPPRREG